MPPDARALAEWSLDLTLNGVTHRIVLVARGADGIRQTLLADEHRRTMTIYRLLDTNETLRIDWDEVTGWSLGEIRLHRTFPGPGTP